MRRIITAAFGIALTTAACGTSSAATPTWTFAPPAAAAPATAPSSATPTATPAHAAAPENSSRTAAGNGAGDGGSGGPAAIAPATAAVRIANFTFGPETVTIQAGGRVTWTNTDGDRHSILLDGSESPRLDQNATHSQAFSSPGRFNYVCGLHSSMSGLVVVVPAGSPGSTAGDPGPTGGTTTAPSGTPSPDPTAAPTASPDDRDDDGGDDDDDRDDDDHSGPGGGGDDGDDDGGDEDHSGPGGGGSGHG